MRILICSLNYAPELIGIGKYNSELAEWLVGRGHEVKVVCAPPYYPAWRVSSGHRRWWWRKETINGVEVRRCPMWVPGRPTGAKRVLHLLTFGLSSLAPLLKQVLWRPDVVMMTEPPLVCAPTVLAVSRLCGAQAWLHVQDLEIDAGFGLGLIRRPVLRRAIIGIERRLLRGFDAVSAISRTMVSRVDERVGAECRTGLLPNWVDTEAFAGVDPMPFRRRLGIPDDAVLCVYSGNMGHKQGLEVVAESILRLDADPRLHFVLCGAGPAKEMLRTCLSGRPRVRFLDVLPADELPELLSAADIHLLPQRADFDGLVMPSKVLAMLASGRAIAATCPPQSELGRLLAGVGLVTAPGAADAYAAAIAKLAEDPVLRASLGIAGQRVARREFDGSRLLEEFERWAEGLLQDRPDEQIDSLSALHRIDPISDRARSPRV
ncbi:MAG: WcaI family glycosyltransferase [Burkholderiales bacterium]|jgi:colanic acid biosynthesis glycosyl transferase WcaI|nr:WcaI family glycosyltransferase [Burkholderiales bacterium]